MTRLSLRLETAGSSSSQGAVTGWLLPNGRWLTPVVVAGAFVVVSGPNVTPGVLIKTEPANGHHRFAACVTPSSEALTLAA